MEAEYIQTLTVEVGLTGGGGLRPLLRDLVSFLAIPVGPFLNGVN